MSTRSASPTARAPPDPPSPITAVMMGVGSDAISSKLVAVQPIAMELDEIGEHGVDVIERIGAAGMAGDLDALHGREIAVDLDPQLGELLLERAHVFGEVGVLGRHAFQLLDLLFQLEERLLEIERIGGHQALTSCTPSTPRMSRRAVSKSSAASTRKARLFSRTVSFPEPFTPLHSRNTGVGPGCAAHNAAMARAVSGSGALPAVQRSATPMAPLGRSSSSARAPSTMNGACSSPRSRGLYPPVRRYAPSARITLFSLAQASGNESASTSP